ncbi:hypothetical protein CEN39_15940 [Fischerella thermalis CCMEE 5201]|jgi:hypothetical protein|nr:hypothetical protein CEN39_15940 [Fischerella thermalis CCMEE 5201]
MILFGGLPDNYWILDFRFWIDSTNKSAFLHYQGIIRPLASILKTPIPREQGGLGWGKNICARGLLLNLK